jgi:hypothetical protein
VCSSDLEFAGQNAQCPFCQATVSVPVRARPVSGRRSRVLARSLGVLGTVAAVTAGFMVFMNRAGSQHDSKPSANAGRTEPSTGLDAPLPAANVAAAEKIPELLVRGGFFWSSPEEVRFGFGDGQDTVQVTSTVGMMTVMSAKGPSMDVSGKQPYHPGPGYWLWPSENGLSVSTNGQPMFPVNWHIRPGQQRHEKLRVPPQARLLWVRKFVSGSEQHGVSRFAVNLEAGADGGEFKFELPFEEDVQETRVVLYVETEQDGRSNLLEMWFKRNGKSGGVSVARKPDSPASTQRAELSPGAFQSVILPPGLPLRLAHNGWFLTEDSTLNLDSSPYRKGEFIFAEKVYITASGRDQWACQMRPSRAASEAASNAVTPFGVSPMAARERPTVKLAGNNIPLKPGLGLKTDDGRFIIAGGDEGRSLGGEVVTEIVKKGTLIMPIQDLEIVDAHGGVIYPKTEGQRANAK